MPQTSRIVAASSVADRPMICGVLAAQQSAEVGKGLNRRIQSCIERCPLLLTQLEPMPAGQRLISACERAFDHIVAEGAIAKRGSRLQF